MWAGSPVNYYLEVLKEKTGSKRHEVGNGEYFITMNFVIHMSPSTVKIVTYRYYVKTRNARRNFVAKSL
jgi:hypothetical protein